MTVMLLALIFSDAAANASELAEYKIVSDREGGGAEPHVVSGSSGRSRAWSPRVDWSNEKSECPIFFTKEVDGFGTLRVGPRCAAEDLPHAL